MWNFIWFSDVVFVDGSGNCTIWDCKNLWSAPIEDSSNICLQTSIGYLSEFNRNTSKLRRIYGRVDDGDRSSTRRSTPSTWARFEDLFDGPFPVISLGATGGMRVKLENPSNIVGQSLENLSNIDPNENYLEDLRKYIGQDGDDGLGGFKMMTPSVEVFIISCLIIVRATVSTAKPSLGGRRRY